MIRVVGFEPLVPSVETVENDPDEELVAFLNKYKKNNLQPTRAGTRVIDEDKHTMSEEEEESVLEELQGEKVKLVDWMELPEVVVIQIFFFLSPRDVVWGVELTCREWKRVSSSEFLWEALHRRVFGGKKPAKKGAINRKGKEGDELGWREHCLRSARYLTYMRTQGTPDDVLRWCCACGHLSLFSCMLREGEFTQRMLEGEEESLVKQTNSPQRARRQEAMGREENSNRKKGMAPIHLAAMCGDERMTEMLALRGVDVNRKDSRGATPLSIAAKMGHLPVVEVLLRFGAVGDDFTKILDNKTRNAAKNRKSRKKGDADALPLLHSAVAGGHTQIVNKLLERAAERGQLGVPASVDKKLRTPLHWAAEGGYLPLIELLLRRGAPIQERAVDFCTPLHLAVGKNQIEAARLLLQKKAPVTPTLDPKIVSNAEGTEGEKSPLQMACERGLFSMAKLLLEYGADIDMRSKGKGRTILHFAVTGGEGSVELVEYLIAKGAAVNVLDKKGSMPIHRLCSHPSPDSRRILEALINAKADVDAKGREDKVPLEILLSRWIRAQQRWRQERRTTNQTGPLVRQLVETLLRHGASPNQALMDQSGLWKEEGEEEKGEEK